MNIDVVLFNYTRVFSDGPRNFGRVRHRAGTPSPNYYITPMGECLSLERYNMHLPPTRQVFSGTSLELTIRRSQVRYLDP
ncbi:hypothetical protein TNCV_4384951 [Trichonephila clavipes]|nr:hypothetical protein TNCV_4384951 [Trichonephila clavipes]